jgi:hypothetical protein
VRGLTAAAALVVALTSAACGGSTAIPSTSDPGLLAPTATEPSTTAGVSAALRPVWQAIVDNDPSAAHAAFFPRSAYLRMKAGKLADPASDYAGRLLGIFDQDIGAYAAELGADPTGAVLVAVTANAGDSAWIPPGACRNTIGYWHLPGARFVYRVHGTVRSFAVASLISWRGAWYVVHLGPNPRPFPVGSVDLPERGAGTPGPAGGC